MTERKEQCETCRWWCYTAMFDGLGECRRYPARIVEVMLETDKPSNFTECLHEATLFPVLELDDWCGEWRHVDIDTTPDDPEMLRRDIAEVLKQLSYREREILKLRYGLGDGLRYTLEECGHIFKVTRERIRGIEKKAIEKLRKMPSAEAVFRRATTFVGDPGAGGESPTDDNSGKASSNA